MRHTLATISAAFASLMLAALGVWPASALAAAPIVTPVVTGCSSVSLQHQCRVLNAGTAAAAVTIEIVDAVSGLVVGTQDPLVSPGRSGVATVSSSDLGACTSYCRVSGISKNKARVTLCATNLNATMCESTVAMP